MFINPYLASNIIIFLFILRTVKISMNSVEIPAYNIKVYKWVLSLNYNKINLILESPAPPPVRSPHLVNWFHKDKSAANFRFEKSEEKEYNDMYYELRQPARQKTKQGIVIVYLNLKIHICSYIQKLEVYSQGTLLLVSI